MSPTLRTSCVPVSNSQAVATSAAKPGDIHGPADVKPQPPRGRDQFAGEDRTDQLISLFDVRFRLTGRTVAFRHDLGPTDVSLSQAEPAYQRKNRKIEKSEQVFGPPATFSLELPSARGRERREGIDSR